MDTLEPGARRAPETPRRTLPRTPPVWKRLKGKNPEGKNFRKLLRRKQSSAKISKISRNTIKSSKSDIFYLLRNLLKYLLRTFFSSTKFSEVFTLCVFTLWLFPTCFLGHSGDTSGPKGPKDSCSRPGASQISGRSASIFVPLYGSLFGLVLLGAFSRRPLSCARLRVPPVALHVSQLISWIL